MPMRAVVSSAQRRNGCTGKGLSFAGVLHSTWNQAKGSAAAWRVPQRALFMAHKPGALDTRSSPAALDCSSSQPIAIDRWWNSWYASCSDSGSRHGCGTSSP